MSNRFSNSSDNSSQLKNVYRGPILNQFNEELPIYRAAEKVKEGWSGLKVVRNLRVRRNQGIGAGSDGGVLPSIGRQTNVQATIRAKFLWLRFGITGPMIKSSQSRDGSFVEQAGYELEQGYNDLKSDVNRQLTWDGTGYLAKLSANALATTSISVQGREGTTEQPNKFLDVDLIVDIVTSAGVYKAQGVTITSVSVSGSTATVVLDSPVTASSGDFLVRANSYNAEVQGILASLDGLTTSVYDIDRSIYTIYQGNVTSLSGGQLTLDALQGIENDIGRRSGRQADAVYSDYDSKRFYQKLLTPDKRYVNTIEGDGGFADKGKSYLEWNGKPWVADKDCPQRVLFLTQDTWKAYVLAEMEFADETGAMYIAQSDVDALEVRIRHWFNIFNEQPNANGALKTYVSP